MSRSFDRHAEQAMALTRPLPAPRWPDVLAAVVSTLSVVAMSLMGAVVLVAWWL